MIDLAATPGRDSSKARHLIINSAQAGMPFLPVGLRARGPTPVHSVYSAVPTTPAIGRPIEVVQVRVDKQRGPIGVILESSPKAFPAVTHIPEDATPYDLRVGDVIAAVNGRPSRGAKTVARTIIQSRHTDLEVWRAIRPRRIDQESVQGVVVASPGM